MLSDNLKYALVFLFFLFLRSTLPSLEIQTGGCFILRNSFCIFRIYPIYHTETCKYMYIIYYICPNDKNVLNIRDE